MRCKDFQLISTPGTENVADMLRKHARRKILCKHMPSMGLKQIEGSAAWAPQIGTR